LASTLIIASAFVIVFFADDNDSSRANMRWACLLVIIGVSTVAIWSAIYFVWLYKKDSVTTGNDGVGFIKATRKQEVVITLYVACCVDALFAYFLCVVGQYITALNPPEEENMMMMMEEAADDKSNKSKAKSDGMKAMEDAGAAMGGDMA
jgi:NADH:ubiquinone oxidoreductase subunit 4 (subunit M)